MAKTPVVLPAECRFVRDRMPRSLAFFAHVLPRPVACVPLWKRRTFRNRPRSTLQTVNVTSLPADGSPHRLYVYAFPGYGHYLSASDGELTIWAEPPEVIGRIDW